MGVILAILVGMVVLRLCYLAGEGMLHAAVSGFFSMARESGAGAIATGELMRFFAEAPWFPISLLPRHGVHWMPVDTNKRT